MWEALRPQGEFTAVVDGDRIDPRTPPTGHLELSLDSLTSGNRVYDSELLRRVQAHLHPSARAELTAIERVADDRYRAEAQLTFHAVTRPLSGTLTVKVGGDDTILMTGEHVIDIRDFDVPPPTMLMLKIYPDVRIHLVLHGQPVEQQGG